MIKFIPLDQYYSVYIHFTLFLVIANLVHAYTVKIDDLKNIRFLRTTGLVLLILLIMYLGLRPISGRYFGDMGTYSIYFKNYASGANVTTNKDYLFHYYIKFMSNFTNVHGFFLVTEFLYIFPMFLISKKNFKEYWFYGFFMFVVSFSFFTYGVNGIRNGVATSMFLLALCYPKNKKLMILFLFLAGMFHKTMLLPILAYIIASIYSKPKFYLKGWLFSIPISLFAGSIMIALFTSLGFGDDRLAGYLTNEVDSEKFSSTGFRWDFLFYSSFAVFAGWYFIFKKKFNDSLYNKIYITYLICNAFWVMVIKANFSNRFAYLSWFLMAIVIIFPLLKQRFFKHQEIVIGKISTAYFMFTYLMWLLYYS